MLKKTYYTILKIKRLIFIVTFLCIALLPGKAQNQIIPEYGIEYNINVCCNILLQGQESLYKDVEDYVKAINLDSINNNIRLNLSYDFLMMGVSDVLKRDHIAALSFMEDIDKKLELVKDNAAYKDIYLDFSYNMGLAYQASDIYDKAEKALQNFIIASDNDVNNKVYTAYLYLANIYAHQDNEVLSKNAHSKCQEYVVRMYVKEHPEEMYKLDVYKTFASQKAQLERENKTLTKDYLIVLCTLGYDLYNICGQEYFEPFYLLTQANVLAEKLDMLKLEQLDNCFPCLLDMNIKLTDEPGRTETLDKFIIPDMIEHYDGKYTTCDIYKHVGTTFRKYNQYEQAARYDSIAINSITIEEDPSKDKEKGLLKDLVIDLESINTEEANKYLMRLKKLVKKEDGDIYEWTINEEKKFK